MSKLTKIKSFLIAFMMIVFASFYAYPVIDTTNVTKPGKVNSLSRAEIELEEKLGFGKKVTVDEVLASLEEEVTQVKVFDLNGNIVLEQNDGIDLDKLPLNAVFLMKDRNARYYILED